MGPASTGQRSGATVRLALMQHHGAATRLLDFTKSPFVAAFFALNTSALWNLTPGFDTG